MQDTEARKRDLSHARGLAEELEARTYQSLAEAICRFRLAIGEAPTAEQLHTWTAAIRRLRTRQTQLP